MGFLEQMQSALGQGYEASKVFLEKAGQNAKDLGEKGALKWELLQLNAEITKACARLGARVFELSEEGRSRLDLTTGDLAEILSELNALKDKVEAKEAAFKAL